MDPDQRARVVMQVADLYTAGLREHGTASKAVGWRDRASQWLRFEKLAAVVDHPSAAGFTVNDLGCGYAAMFRYLTDRFGDALSGYRGYDVSEPMLAAARAFAADPRAEFVQATRVTEDADYSFVSGTFNVKFGASDAQWTEYVDSMVLDMAARSTRGLAFNLLTTDVDWREPHLYYGDPSHFLNFCRRHVSRNVTLLHDYPLYEWTILVRK